MTHVVAEPCSGCKYTDCVVVCPVECFYEGEQMLYIHPEECIDCEACVPECPVEAIFHEDNLPEEWKSYLELNATKSDSGECDVLTEKKEPLADNSELANQASKVFWETLHQGDYSNISKPMTLLKAAYLQNPYDAKIAARIGFLHAWSLTERQSLKNIPPQITDNAILARKYFEEAVRLNPEDARYLGFHSSMMMSEGSIHKDAYLTRKGYFQGLDSIEAWPQFNLFTIGYTMSSKEHSDPKFREAVEMQRENIDKCIDDTIDRNNPDFSNYFEMESSEKRESYKRACWNSWIAPYNLQGFFMNFGDMLVKEGKPEIARKIYQTAMDHPDFETWPYKEYLIRRIENADRNVEKFRANNNPSADVNDSTIMIKTTFGCMGCHQN